MEKEVFQQMLDEFTWVNEKASKLREFLTDEEKVKTVDNLNKDLMIAQLKAMEAYLSNLSIRIGLNAPREMAEAAQEELANQEEQKND